MNIDSFKSIEDKCLPLFSELSALQRTIKEKLEAHADGKVLKGNEIVGWLGEIYGKFLFDGFLVDDSYEHDVETEDGMRISVKTRKGEGPGWTRTSAIPKIEGVECPTHLLFVHLDDDYLVDKIWLFPWSGLLSENRFKKHTVRGNFRSYYVSIRPQKDELFLVYAR